MRRIALAIAISTRCAPRVAAATELFPTTGTPPDAAPAETPQGVPPTPPLRANVVTSPSPQTDDDVVTSGATLDACARALLDAGAAEVRCVTWARAD